MYVLVFVDLTELILVAAFELPKLAFTEPEECTIVPIAYHKELVVFFQVLAYALLFKKACKVRVCRGAMG